MAQMLCFCLLMLPIAGYSLWSEWHYERETQRSQLLHTVKSLAARQTALIRGSESLLLAMSVAPLVRLGDPDKVFPFLARFDQVQQDYSGIALFRLDGTSVISFLNGRVHSVERDIIQKRRYFQQSLAQNAFSIGEALELEDGRLMLPMTMPVFGSDGRPHFILMMPLGFDRQHRILDTILKENGEQVAFYDGVQKRIFAHPRSAGKSFSQSFVNDTLIPHSFIYTEGCTNESLFTFSDPNGKSCIGVMLALHHKNMDQPYQYILVFDERLSWKVFLQQRHILQLAALLVVIFLLLYTASWMGRWCFVEGLGKMADVALKTGGGITDARCGTLTGCREIVILGKTFDGMLDNLQRTVQRLRELSIYDPLTGLWNRRQFSEAALQELSVAVRYGHPVSLAMADIDHFKWVNDTHGHAGGDAVLQHLASLFRENIRAADMVARFGGEEFIFLFPHTSEESAVAVLEDLRRLSEETVVPYLDGKISFSVSFGVAEWTRAAGDSVMDVSASALLDELVRRADAALYASKEHGRNRVTPASSLERPHDV